MPDDTVAHATRFDKIHGIEPLIFVSHDCGLPNALAFPKVKFVDSKLEKDLKWQSQQKTARIPRNLSGLSPAVQPDLDVRSQRMC